MSMMTIRPVRPTDAAQTRFLDAAEQLFSAYGYEGTKIRAIAKLANANLGLLSQYWGTKKELFRAVFERRLKPIHDAEMARLGALQDRIARGQPVDLVDVLRAKIEPSFIAPGVDPDEASQRRLLMGRARLDPSQDVVDVMSEFFNDVGSAFFSLLRQVCSDLAPTDFYWRANCVAGAFSFIEAYCDRLAMFIDEDISDVDWVEASNHVVGFLAVGMRARPAALVLAPSESPNAQPPAKMPAKPAPKRAAGAATAPKARAARG